MRIALVIIAAAVAVAGCDHSAAKLPRVVGDYTKFTSAGTLTIGRERVRLANVDTPKLAPFARCWAEASLSEAAAASMQQVLYQAKTIAVHRLGRASDGTTIGTVLLNGSDLGETMIRVGYAAPHTSPAFDWCGRADFNASSGPVLSVMAGARPNVDRLFRSAIVADDRQLEAARDAPSAEDPQSGRP